MGDLQDRQEKPINPVNPDSEIQDPYTLEDYNRDMSEGMQGNYHALARIGLPKPKFDTGGIWFFLMLPVLFVWLFLVDPFHGWKRWRVVGLLLGALVAALMFVLLVFVGVQHEIGGQFGMAEDDATFLIIENIGAGGLAGVILFIWPRTIALILILAAVVSVIRVIF